MKWIWGQSMKYTSDIENSVTSSLLFAVANSISFALLTMGARFAATVCCCKSDYLCTYLALYSYGTR